MLLSDFEARKLRSIPTLPKAALTEIFYADAETNIHPLSTSLYFICSSPW